MYGHLISVEVGVEGGANERMQAYRLAFYEHRLKGLNAQAVQSRRAVQHDGMVLYYLLEYPPYFVAPALYEAARALHVRCKSALDKLVHDEGLEELERHLLRDAALIYLEVRPDDDDGTPRVVDALAEQILAEASFFTAQEVGEALQRPIAGSEHGLAAASVVYEGVYRFLQHPLLVADDNFRRLQLLQLAQAVVAVYHAAVKVVEVGCGEASAVKLHHRAKVGRDDRQDRKHHPFGARIALAEILRDLEALD